MARVCEEFACTPSQAVYEIEHAPYPLVWDVLDLRAYAHAKHKLDTAKKKSDVELTPMVETVMEIQARIIRAERDKRLGR